MDAEGCENSTTFEVEASVANLSIDLSANLVGRNVVVEGEPIQLIALTNVPLDQLDSIVWSHPDLLSCIDCLNPTATLTEAVTVTVTAYLNGCEVSDELLIHVEYESPIYVPNAFSPNSDNVNDLFQIYAGDRVVNIKSFTVFDRWGEMVYIHKDFVPNEPPTGWDGTFHGEPMQPAVYVWFAEVELVDGTTELLEGDVTLIR